MLKRTAFLIILLSSTFLFANTNQIQKNEETPKTPVKMSVNFLESKNKNYLVLSYINHPHWHTYWKNPGDAGLPIKFNFQINNQKQNYKELNWPLPQKYIEEGNMWAYGYEGSYSLFFKLENENLKKIKTNQLKVSSNWLVCKHICIPGKKEYLINKLKPTTPMDFSINKDELLRRLDSLPVLSSFPKDLELTLTKSPGNKENSLTLYSVLTSSGDKKLRPELGFLTPYPQIPFTFKHEKVYLDKSKNLYHKLEIDWDGEYTEPEMPMPMNGIFKTPFKLRFLYNNPVTKKIEIIEKKFSSFSLTASKQYENFFTSLGLSPIKAEDKIKDNPDKNEVYVKQKKEKNSLLFYIIFGIIGGLILNFMPCVLPVISIKLFGLIKHQGQARSKILAHNLSYTFGVLFSFMVLATVVVLLKSTGENVGWGFQLQSPSFIAFMILILFIFALNLFGLFEFKTPGGNKIGGLQLEDGPIGDFFSGILATILSTPCSAPFLGTALTFAFTSGTLSIYYIFFSIGFGLSLPFIITGLYPPLVSFLPKPGIWMENLKKILGLTLIMTIIWLLDVFSSQVETSLAVIKINTTLVIAFFLFYMRKTMTKKMLYTIPLSILLALFFYSSIIGHDSNSMNKGDLLKDKVKSGLHWKKWSEEKMLEHKANNELVFIDFTAKWCFTCKVNEKLVLETDGFNKLVEKYNIKLLLGDWTKKDPIIGAWLKKNGMVGVPAYFIQMPNGELHNLGETITLTKIEKYLNLESTR